MESKLRILAINPGSTSTKIGVYEEGRWLLEKTIRYEYEDLKDYTNVVEQKEMRKSFILEALKEENIPLSSLKAIVGRGGIVKPVESGTYVVNDKLFYDLTHGDGTRHASSLGGIIGYELGKELGIQAYIVDPVVVDEMIPIAKITGIKGIQRRSIFHALNSKFIARRLSGELNKEYSQSRLIVAHLGGGISVSAHLEGRVIDVNDASAGEGPFSPERAGTLPTSGVIELCFSGEYTKEEVYNLVMSQSGMLMHLGTKNLQEVEKRIQEGDEYGKLVVEAMAYQVSKQIGAMAAALEGEVEGIALTGGLAYSKTFTELIKKRVEKFAPVYIYPGEDELLAMVEGVLMVLSNKDKAKEYLG